MMEFDNIYSAWEYIELNGYKVYTIYCGGLDITVIEVVGVFLGLGYVVATAFVMYCVIKALELLLK